MKKYFIYFLLFLMFVSVFAGYFFYKDFQFHTNRPYMNYEKQVLINIKKGMTVYEIGKHLYLKGIISSYSYFRIYFKLYFSDVMLRSGDYSFNKPLTMSEVILKLSKGQFIPYRVTIKDGMTLNEIIDYLSKNYYFKKKNLSRCSKT